MKFVGQLKNPDDAVVTNESMFVANESMFILTILEKIKETRLKFPQESLTVL